MTESVYRIFLLHFLSRVKLEIMIAFVTRLSPEPWFIVAGEKLATRAAPRHLTLFCHIIEVAQKQCVTAHFPNRGSFVRKHPIETNYEPLRTCLCTHCTTYFHRSFPGCLLGGTNFWLAAQSGTTRSQTFFCVFATICTTVWQVPNGHNMAQLQTTKKTGTSSFWRKQRIGCLL